MMSEDEYNARKREIKIKIYENFTSAKNWAMFLSFFFGCGVYLIQKDWLGAVMFALSLIAPATQIVAKTRQNIEFKKLENGGKIPPITIIGTTNTEAK